MTTTNPTGSPGTPIHPARDPGSPPRDLRPLWRVLLAVVIPLGPLGIAAVRAVMPYWTDDAPADMVAGMLAEPGRAEAMTWIFFVAYPALIGGALAVGYVARRGAPRLATAGALLTFVSFVMVGTAGSTDLLVHVLGREGVDQDTIVAASDAVMAHPTSSIGLGLFVVGHITGMILLGLAVTRAGLVPVWVGAMIVVSQPIHLVSAVFLPNRALDVVAGWGFTFVGFLFVALAVLRMSDDEIDLPPRSS